MKKIQIFNLKEKNGYENFRFIRLNLSGKSFGFSYKNDAEEAIIFSEFPVKVTAELMFEIAQIFPHYLLVEEDGKLTMKPAQFQSEFEKVKDLTALTEQAENGEYIRLAGYNIEDLLEQAEEIGFLSPLCFGRDGRKHFIYITKGF